MKYFLLREPSATVPLRLHRLKTFSNTKKQQKKVMLKGREQKLVSRCLRRRLASEAQAKSSGKYSGEQYLELPRAICNEDASQIK